MGKVLKVVGAVVGIAALVIPGVGPMITGQIFGALGTVTGTLGAAAAVAHGVATMVTAGLMMAGISMGISTVAGVLGLGPKPPKVSYASSDRLKAGLNPRATRKIVFGYTAANTDVHYQEFTGSNQDTLNTILTLASHELQSIEEIWFDEKLAWSAAGGVQAGFTGFLAVTTRPVGTAANAFTITGSFSWVSSASRMVGNAYVWLRYTLSGNNSPFASAVSSRITVRCRGAKLYDPRLDSTVGGSGAHRANDQTTWAWVSDNVGRNPALQLLWYLLGWRIQNPVTAQWKLAVGLGLPVDRIDIPSFIAAANICDESVALAAGGTEPRYRSDGVFGEDDDPSVVFENLCAAMNGVMRDNGGKLSLAILTNDLGTPVADFTAADVIDGFTWLQTPPIDQNFNIVRGQYIDATNAGLYQPVDYPDVVLTSPDGIDRSKTFDFAMVQSASQAQRLAKTYLQRAQYPGTFTADFLASAWRCQVGSVVRLTFPALGFSNKLFRVIEHSIRVDGRCPMVLREENAAIYAWSAGEAAAVVAAAPISYNPLNDPLRTELRDLPFGTNLLVNSEMLLMDSAVSSTLPFGWMDGWVGDSSNVGTLTFNGRRVALKDGYGYARDVTGNPNGSAIDCTVPNYVSYGMSRVAIPVQPGDQLAASALIGYQNCTQAYVIIGYYDENGAYVSEAGSNAVNYSIGATAYGSIYKTDLAKASFTTTVPADGGGSGTGKRRWALLWTRFSISGSPTNPRLLTASPLLAKVKAGQAAVPPYIPGPSDRQASYGATTGSNLVSATYGTLGDSAVYTPLGTAAAIAGQTAWATYTSYTPDQVTKPAANLLFNSSFNIGSAGFVTGAWSGPNVSAGDVGKYFMSTNANGTALYTTDVTKIIVATGNAYTFQVWVAANGTSSGTNRPYIYIDWHNSSGGFISSSSPVYIPIGAPYQVVSITATAPAGAVYARPVMQSNQIATGGGAMYTSKWKFELGSSPTPWSDEATNGALYQSGQTIDSLKPAQANADVTGSNVAAAITGQAPTATNSDYSAVTGTKPPSDATNGAPSGTSVAGRAATDVAGTIASGGGVDVNKVSTTSIVTNGVTATGSVFTATGSTYAVGTGGFFTHQTLSFTCSGGPLIIIAGAALAVSGGTLGTDYTVSEVRLKRGSTILSSQRLTVFTSGSGTLQSSPLTFSYTDNPGAGSHTYTIEFYVTSVTSSFLTHNPLNTGINILETKR